MRIDELPLPRTLPHLKVPKLDFGYHPSTNKLTGTLGINSHLRNVKELKNNLKFGEDMSTLILLYFIFKKINILFEKLLLMVIIITTKLKKIIVLV